MECADWVKHKNGFRSIWANLRMGQMGRDELLIIIFEFHTLKRIMKFIDGKTLLYSSHLLTGITLSSISTPKLENEVKTFS